MWRPGPRPAPLGRSGHIYGVPSRPKHPAQPLALDVGSPRAALVAGKGYFFASVRGSPHPTGPACSHDPCASKTISARLPPARFANGRWPVPWRGAGLRGRQDRRWPGTVARGDVCHHVGAYENPRAPRRSPASAHPRASCAQPRARSPMACRRAIVRAYAAHCMATSSGAYPPPPRSYPSRPPPASGRLAPHPLGSRLHALRAPLLRSLLTAINYTDCIERMLADLQACPAG